MEYPLDRFKFGATEKSVFGRPKPILYEIMENECWEVINRKPNADGYYKININNKTMLLHRLIYQQENNCSITSKDIVRHKCDNPKCINPQHLEIGTVQDNIQDRIIRKRNAINENHGMSKLTNEQVKEIYFALGTQQQIANQYHVSQKLVSLIKRKEIHKDLLENF